MQGDPLSDVLKVVSVYCHPESVFLEWKFFSSGCSGRETVFSSIFELKGKLDLEEVHTKPFGVQLVTSR